jgi:energy-coupling factor transporter ATP-binding protein EcfA2
LAVIEVEHLQFAYPPVLPGGQPFEVLRGVNLVVERGEFLSLMGPTGAGKSTLCMAMNGIVPQSTGGVISGRVAVLGHDTRSMPVAQLAAHVGIVYQDPESQLFCATLEDEVAFGPENLGIAPQEIAERVSWALDVVSMAGYRTRSSTQLSGGQKQRVAIAASLAMLPEVLILDEPTSGLDPVGQFEVFSVIERLCRERRMTIIMVSQDAERIAEFSDRLAILWQGQIVAHDTPLRVFEDTELLREVGLAAPQVSELALALNRRCGTDYHFVLLDEAARELQRALAGERGTS